MKNVKLLTALLTAFSPLLTTIPFNAETANNEETSVVEETSTENNEESTTNEETANNEVSPIADVRAEQKISEIFPDPVLADQVSTATGIAVDAEITQAELDTVQYVSLFGASNLTGINKLTNLVNLSLNDSTVTDLSLIENLANLEILLINNPNVAPQFTSYDSIGTLTNLKTLYVMNQGLTETSFLANLTAVEVLGLARNYLVEAPEVRNMTSLRNLDITSNGFTSSSVAAMLPASVDLVNANYNSIFDMTVFNNVANVQAEGQFAYSIVDQFSTNELANDIIFMNYFVKSVDGTSLAPAAMTAGATYNVAENKIYMKDGLTHNEEFVFTFNNANANPIELPNGPVLPDTLSTEGRNMEYRAVADNNTRAANTYNSFSGIVVYKFKANDYTGETVNPEGTLPETGINNYGMIAGSGTLAVSALSMFARKRVRK